MGYAKDFLAAQKAKAAPVVEEKPKPKAKAKK